MMPPWFCRTTKMDQRQVNRHRIPLFFGVNSKAEKLSVEPPFDNGPSQNSEFEISLARMIDFLGGRHLPRRALAFRGKT